MFIFVTCDVSPFAGFAWFLARAVLKTQFTHNMVHSYGSQTQRYKRNALYLNKQKNYKHKVVL